MVNEQPKLETAVRLQRAMSEVAKLMIPVYANGNPVHSWWKCSACGCPTTQYPCINCYDWNDDAPRNLHELLDKRRSFAQWRDSNVTKLGLGEAWVRQYTRSASYQKDSEFARFIDNTMIKARTVPQIDPFSLWVYTIEAGIRLGCEHYHQVRAKLIDRTHVVGYFRDKRLQPLWSHEYINHHPYLNMWMSTILDAHDISRHTLIMLIRDIIVNNESVDNRNEPHQVLADLRNLHKIVRDRNYNSAMTIEEARFIRSDIDHDQWNFHEEQVGMALSYFSNTPGRYQLRWQD